MLPLDEGVVPVGGDEVNLPGESDFTSHAADVADAQAEVVQSHPHSSPPGVMSEETASTAASAPHRRARSTKALEFDSRPGLTNNELRQWNEHYLENMQQALVAKHRYKLTHQAKKNAEYWVLGYGIGDVGRGLGQDHAFGPLQTFSGASLLASLTGACASIAGTKRARSSSITSAAEEEKERRVRVRDEYDDQAGRGLFGPEQALTGLDVEGIFAGDEEMVPQTRFH